MKPRIRKATSPYQWVRQFWVCMSPSVVPGQFIHYKAGVGDSPTQAYSEWARFNDVNQDS